MNLRVAIIIPFQKENDYLKETIFHIHQLRYKDVEIILLPDEKIPDDFARQFLSSSFSLQIVPTGAVSPAIKRDIGVEHCQGEIVAFIDDDAYPDSLWLENALPWFQNPAITAIGGPQITPDSDTFWQQVSGAMFLSPLNGKAVYRYRSSDKQFFVEDWPSVNLLVRKADFIKVGGFDSQYWPGEDTKLCADLIAYGKKIAYAGNAIVYHHRRSGFRRHMKQIGNYGLHRGYFAKKYPSTSLKLSYAMPSGFFLFVTCGWIFLLLPLGFVFYFALWGIYSFALFYSTIRVWGKTGKLGVAVATIPYILGTHFWYGNRFLQGLLFTDKLKSKLGR